MVVLNMRYQLDTPTGLVDTHVFIVDDEADGYLVYHRQNNKQVQKRVKSFREAIGCVKAVVDELEVPTCLSSPSPTQMRMVI